MNRQNRMQQVRRFIRCERGQSELVEFVGLFPIFIGMVLMLVQTMDAGHTLFTAMDASRAGVRAAAVGDNCGAAASQVTQAWTDDSRRIECWCGEDTCRVNVELRLRSNRVPLTSRLMSNFWVEHDATMRNEQ